MKLLYKLSIVTIVILLIGMIGMIWWCMRKRYVEKFEDNNTQSIISSFSRTVDQMLMRQAMDNVVKPDEKPVDEMNENNSA
jgi:FtsZ-interacting cell division protein ZipA